MLNHTIICKAKIYSKQRSLSLLLARDQRSQKSRPLILSLFQILVLLSKFTGYQRQDQRRYSLKELSIGYGLGNKAELTLVVPYSKHSGGNLDGFIENWHSFFDLPDGGRRHSPKNRLLYQVKNNGRESFALGPNSTGAFGDISIIFSKNLSDRKNQLWKVSAGVKLPSGKFSDLSGSEFTSFFSMAHYSNLSILRFPKWHFNQTLGVLKNNADNLFETKVKSLVYFGSSQVGRKVRERLDLKFQLDYHTSFYSSDLKQLGKASAQLVLGGTIKVSESFALDLSITEDIAANTAPDVTFSLGLRRTF